MWADNTHHLTEATRRRVWVSIARLCPIAPLRAGFTADVTVLFPFVTAQVAEPGG
jgi:hypothetical protein